MKNNSNNDGGATEKFMKDLELKSDEIFNFGLVMIDKSRVMDGVIKAKNIHLDYKAMMWKIFELWIEECAKENRMPFDVLIPVPFSDIKDSRSDGYMEILMEQFRKDKNKK